MCGIIKTVQEAKRRIETYNGFESGRSTSPVILEAQWSAVRRTTNAGSGLHRVQFMGECKEAMVRSDDAVAL